MFWNDRFSRFSDEFLVATDDDRVQAAVERFGGTAVMTPASCPSGSDRIAAALVRAADAAETFVTDGIEQVMNRFNRAEDQQAGG